MCQDIHRLRKTMELVRFERTFSCCILYNNSIPVSPVLEFGSILLQSLAFVNPLT